jgi:queuine tRNA-ribosyltransferase
MEFNFVLEKQRGNARAGRMQTPHGEVLTPIFMPVGTKASVKAVDLNDLEGIRAQIILANTYHLYLRPGSDLIYRMGGLHRFTGFNKPILTDSGGYQVSSLGLFRGEGVEKLSKITPEGVKFKSHLDGSAHFFTPEKAMKIQWELGADIIMAFDEATPDRGKDYARVSMERTHQWLAECVETWQRLENTSKKEDKSPQSLFGIIQGGEYSDLRAESVKKVMEFNLPGIALGGASVGQSASETERQMSFVREWLPVEKPRYLMGVGVGLEDTLEAVKSGADMFDCVAPTKIARSGLLYYGQLSIKKRDIETAIILSDRGENRINLNRKEFSEDTGVIDQGCDCYTCRSGYSRAYLRHLLKRGELSYYRLASIHNLRKMLKLVEDLRKVILD